MNAIGFLVVCLIAAIWFAVAMRLYVRETMTAPERFWKITMNGLQSVAPTRPSVGSAVRLTVL